VQQHQATTKSQQKWSNITMYDFNIEVINAETEDNITGILINKVPYLYWLRVYQALGLERHHAQKVISRLTDGIHYRKFSKEEIYQLSETGNTALPVDYRAKSFVFLTEEGMNRAIIEIRTEYMGDKNLAAIIEAKKDHITSIYTRYQKGEILSIEADKMAESLPSDSPEIKIANENLAIANSFIKYACPHLKIDPGMVISASLSHVEQEIQKIGGNTSLIHLKNMIPRTLEGEPASLTVTEIGKPFGLSGNRINDVLERIGYQIHEYKQSTSGRQKKEWKPTKLGDPHGEWKPVTQGHANGSVHHEYRWYWKESIIPIIRDALFGASEAQQVLA